MDPGKPKKKDNSVKKPTPDEKWVDRLGARDRQTPAGVAVYLGLVRQDPGDEETYLLYPTLDMISCCHIQKEDVVHVEELAADKSPFGSLGGSRLYVRAGAKIKWIRTSTTTLEAGREADEFDLDIRLGPGAGTAAAVNPIVPETADGPICANIPPFSDPDRGGCKTAPVTHNCSLHCPPKTQNRACPPTNNYHTCACLITYTCATFCGGATCNTQCRTCNTQCGTCRTCGGATCFAECQGQIFTGGPQC